MVSQDSSSNPNNSTSKMHQFIIPNSQFGGQHFDAYGNDQLNGGGSPYDPLGPMPTHHLQSFGGERIMPNPQMVENSQVNHTKHLMDLLGASNEANFHAQRLSLSLGNCTLVNSGYLVSHSGENNAPFAANSSSTSEGSIAFSITNSKYLKPAQLLLDEIVKVGSKAIDLSNEKFVQRLSRTSKKGSLKLRSELNIELINNELFTEKHELHAKQLKLIALLEEAERRYEQYYNHIDGLVSSFEMIAGIGAGKSYTALALQAMSRHFCSLREAILSQIYATKRKISQDHMPRISSDMSQLSLFDQETRHTRISLQQLSLIQSSRQAWRPIRGLPETSVAILRAWLFEHFLHPYPNDSEKLTLSSQTGLSKNQVSNWFINARVRLWKPMIEEMYKEEFAESSVESNPSQTRESFADSAED